MFTWYNSLLQNPKIRYWMKEWVEPIIIALLLALFIRAFFVQAFKIPTGSMRMTLLEGDRILVNKLVYRFHKPQRGEIVVFKYPQDRKRDFIKRLIAVGGETVEIKDFKIYINDALVTEPLVIRQNRYYNRDEWAYGKTGQKVHVPEGYYFVLGDNSENSSDSRNWGFVPQKDVIGRAFFIYWPPNRWKVIQ
jgi:signal peptidase I